jgi:hypothetical protein
MRLTHIVAKRMTPGRCLADVHKGQAASLCKEKDPTQSAAPEDSRYKQRAQSKSFWRLRRGVAR